MTSDGFLAVTDAIRIPHSEFTFQFSRSSGPGGQNVNKVNTRVQLRWNVAATEAIPEEIRQRIKSRHRRRVNAEGEMIVTSQRYRDQGRNIDDCLAKLAEIVKEAAARRRPRRRTKPTAASRRRRLQQKRERAQRKQARRPPRLDE